MVGDAVPHLSVVRLEPRILVRDVAGTLRAAAAAGAFDRGADNLRDHGAARAFRRDGVASPRGVRRARRAGPGGSDCRALARLRAPDQPWRAGGKRYVRRATGAGFAE